MKASDAKEAGLTQQMLDAEIYGLLVTAGQSVTVASLVNVSGYSRGLVRGALDRLKAAGRASTTSDAHGRTRWIAEAGQ